MEAFKKRTAPSDSLFTPPISSKSTCNGYTKAPPLFHNSKVKRVRQYPKVDLNSSLACTNSEPSSKTDAFEMRSLTPSWITFACPINIPYIYRLQLANLYQCPLRYVDFSSISTRTGAPRPGLILTRLKLRRKSFGLRWVGRLQVFFIAGLMLARIGRGWWIDVGIMSISRENLGAKEWRA